MRHLRLLQWAYLSAVTLIAVGANGYLGYRLSVKGSEVLTHISETTERYKVIAKETNRVAFYKEHNEEISKELTAYKGVARQYTPKDVPAQQLSREELRERNRQEFFRRQRAAKETEYTNVQGSEKIKLGVPLNLTLPKFLAKVTVTPEKYENGVYTGKISANTEFYRFLEWYTYMFSEYPFSRPKNLIMSITDSNCFRNLPTNINIFGEIEFTK